MMVSMRDVCVFVSVIVENISISSSQSDTIHHLHSYPPVSNVFKSLIMGHGPDQNWYHCDGNFYHTFLESGHSGVHEKSGWTCHGSSLIGEMHCHGIRVSNFGKYT